MNRRYAKEEKLKYVLLLKEGKLDLSLTPEGVSRAASSGTYARGRGRRTGGRSPARSWA